MDRRKRKVRFRRRYRTIKLLRRMLLKCNSFQPVIRLGGVWEDVPISHEEEFEFLLFRSKLEKLLEKFEVDKLQFYLPIGLLCDNINLCKLLLSYGIKDLDQLAYEKRDDIWKHIIEEGEVQGLLLSFAKRYHPHPAQIRYVALRYRKGLREKTIKILKEARYRCLSFLRDPHIKRKTDIDLLEEEDRPYVQLLYQKILLTLRDLGEYKKQYRVPVRLIFDEEISLFLRSKGIYDIDQLGSVRDQNLWQSINPNQTKGKEVYLSFFQRVRTYSRRRSMVLEELQLQKAA